MAISFVGRYQAQQSSQSDGSLAVSNLKDLSNASVTLQQHDIIIVGQTISATSSIVAFMDSAYASAGYTKISSNYRNDNYDANFGLYYKRMGSTPDTTMPFANAWGANNGSVVSYLALRGVDTTTALDAAVSATGNTNTGVINPTAVTPATTGAWIVSMGGSAVASGTAHTNPTTNPFDSIYFESLVHGLTNGAVGYWAIKTGQAAGAAYDAGNLGGGSAVNTSSWSCASIPFRPALAPVWSSGTTANAVSGQTFAYGMSASGSPSYSIVGGADAAHFEISGTTLRWASNGTKDSSSPQDADANNSYVVTLRATAYGGTTDRTVTVTVTATAMQTSAIRFYWF